MRWELIPFWAKDASIGYGIINARAETVLLSLSMLRPEQAKKNVQALGQELATEPAAGKPASGCGLRPSPPASPPEAKIDVSER
jgi:hypothetical protein